MLSDSKEQRKYFCHLLIKLAIIKTSYLSYVTITVGSLNLFNISILCEIVINQEFKALGGNIKWCLILGPLAGSSKESSKLRVFSHPSTVSAHPSISN